MKVGLDARPLIGERTGVGNYLKNIIEAGAFDGHSVQLYHPKAVDDNDLELSASDTTELRWCPISPPSWSNYIPNEIETIWWVNVTLKSALIRDRVDCFFASNFVQPLLYAGPSLAIIHDLAYTTVPETHDFAYRLYLKIFAAGTIQRANHVITVSEHTKRDVVQRYRTTSQDVTVCYGAADERFRPRELSAGNKSELRQKYDLPTSEFLLYVGNVEPRKNLHMLVEGLKLLKPDYQLPLVVVGKSHLAYSSLTDSVETYGGDIRFTGYVSDDDLPLLYNLASAFVYPSLYEGFGLPVVEAMQSGLPVLVSDRSSLPEVVGQAGITVDPESRKEIADGIRQLLTEAQNSGTCDKALRRASEFSWNKSATRINQLIENIN